jgi:hypothetical protein
MYQGSPDVSDAYHTLLKVEIAHSADADHHHELCHTPLKVELAHAADTLTALFTTTLDGTPLEESWGLESITLTTF